VAQDIGGLKHAGPWIEKARPSYTTLIDEKHLVTQLYGMVNVPTAVWINEQGRIVRPNEVAFVDNRFKALHGMEAAPYLDGLRDWIARGPRSPFALNARQVKERLERNGPGRDRLLADTNFRMAQYLATTGSERDAIFYFKAAQQLDPGNWNYKRQAWLLADPDRDYGTNWSKEVQKLNGQPYYAPRELPKQ
jgi:hypothetical protein